MIRYSFRTALPPADDENPVPYGIRWPGWPGAHPTPADDRTRDFELDDWGEPHYLSVPPQSAGHGWLLGGTVTNPDWRGNIHLADN